MEITVDGETFEIIGKAPQEVVDLGIALVPEVRRLFVSLSVEENLILGALRKEARPKIDENLAFVLEAFPALPERRQDRKSAP
mgnify:CR=1 FL=1